MCEIPELCCGTFKKLTFVSTGRVELEVVMFQMMVGFSSMYSAFVCERGVELNC